MKSLQAIDDTYSWTEDSLMASGVLSGNSVSLNVLANDTGTAKQLRSVTGAYGNSATISNGRISYDFSSSLLALGATSIDAMTASDHIHDEFVYTIRNGNGAGDGGLSQATIVIDLWGVNDAASIGGNATGNTLEDTNALAGGKLTVTDVDHGQSVFQAVADTALVGTYGDFTFDYKTGAWGYSLNHGRADSLGYGDVVHDKLCVLSADSTASQIIDVTVRGAIDAPVVSASAAESSIKQGDSVGLNITATDVDHGASLSYVITGVPDGAALTSVADPGGVKYDLQSDSWLVSAGALVDLRLTPDQTFTGEIDLTVKVNNTEANPGDLSDVAKADASAPITVTVTPDTLSYTWTTLDGPQAVSTVALDLNDSDQVVGSYDDSSGQTHGFFDDGTLKTLDPTLSTSFSIATAINTTGQVAGYFADDTGTHCFVYDSVGQSYSFFDAPSPMFLDVASINDGGEVVGSFMSGGGVHSFVYNGGTPIQLDDPSATAFFTIATDVNNLGQVAGYYIDGAGQHGFIYSGGGYTTLDPGQPTDAVLVTAINDAGSVAGYYGDSDNHQHGFYYQNGVCTQFDVTGASDTFLFDFNDVGQITGSYVDGTGQHGFIYNTGSDTLTSFDDVSGVAGALSSAINNLGDVAGEYSTYVPHGFLGVRN